MSSDAFTLQEGMTVSSREGDEIGTVGRVLRHVPAGGASAGAETGYVVVDHGGVPGLGARHYYVPFAAIREVAPGDCATLSCSTEECTARCAAKPAGLADV